MTSTATSSGPNSSVAASSAAAQVVDAARVSGERAPLLADRAAPHPSPHSASMSKHETRAPAAAKVRTHAPPMPLPTPTTKTCLPVNPRSIRELSATGSGYGSRGYCSAK